MIELGLKDSKNIQVPPFQIAEVMEVFGVKYELTGCVLTQAGHFLNVVRHAGQFIVIDSLPWC